MKVLKDIADFFGCETLEPTFVYLVNLTTGEAVRPDTTAFVWLTWLTVKSATFTNSFYDQYNTTTNVQFGYSSARVADEGDRDCHTKKLSCKSLTAHRTKESVQVLIVASRKQAQKGSYT